MGFLKSKNGTSTELEDYEVQGYSQHQMYQIELGEKAGIDTSWYRNPEFDWQKMEQIRLGLEEGIDVSVYAHPEMTVEQMEQYREGLPENQAKAEKVVEETHHKKLINTYLLVGIVVVVAILGVVAFIMRDTLSLYFQKMTITLTTDKIDLKYGEPFISANYVESYTEADNLEFTLPEDESIDTSKVGSYEAVYTLTNGKKKVKKTLLVNVVDTDAPVIVLNETSITLDKATDTFNCGDYIEEAYDEYDGGLRNKVACSSNLDLSLDQQIVDYTVEDSSGNVGDAQLIVNFKDSSEAATTQSSKPATTYTAPKATSTPTPTATPNYSTNGNGSGTTYDYWENGVHYTGGYYEEEWVEEY